MSLNRREFLESVGVGVGSALLAAPSTAQEFPTSSRELWQLLRVQPMLDSTLTWLDTAGLAPSLRSVLIEEYRQREALSQNRDRYLDERCSGEALRELLGKIAEFIGATADDLLITSGATEALSIVAAGLDFTPGDEILTTSHDHPAAVYPWLLQAKRRGLKVVQIAIPSPLNSPADVIEAFTAAITDRTRLMCFSHVLYSDGCVLPVRDLCALARSRNILTLVDGAQALGMLPLDMATLGCDFYAASLHKWVNGPAGTGLLYLGDGARFRLWPVEVADHGDWDSLDRFGAVDVPPSVPRRASWPAALRKFDYQIPTTAPLMHAVAPAIALQQEIGRERVAARIRELAWYLRMDLQRIEEVRVLTPPHPELWAGIVSVEIPGKDHGDLVASLAAQERIVARRVAHSGGGIDCIRVSPHIYNDHSDLDRFVAALRRRVRS
jgi:selenocysteine lyase/cysteine desulfurase